MKDYERILPSFRSSVKKTPTNISSLKLVSPSALLSDGTGRSSTPAAEALPAGRQVPCALGPTAPTCRRPSPSGLRELPHDSKALDSNACITYGGFGEEILASLSSCEMSRATTDGGLLRAGYLSLRYSL